MSYSRGKQVVGLVGWLLLCYGVSAIGALASISAQSFYAELTQPAWAPPPWLFGPVWTILYGMMAISAWLIWRRGGFQQQRQALSLFVIQLGVNAIWSWLFFAWRLGAVAFADIILLWVLILACIVVFWRISRVASLLLMPYLLWVTFAGALNLSLWQLNPQLLG